MNYDHAFLFSQRNSEEIVKKVFSLNEKALKPTVSWTYFVADKTVRGRIK